ncbi:hypothetical protein Tco_0426063 [Tanacetum coccineum]
MRGTLLSSSISRITKSAGKVNLPTSTSIFSAIPIGYWNDRFLVLGWHLEEIHVTWAHLEKERTRLQTYTKSKKKYYSQSVETASRA